MEVVTKSLALLNGIKTLIPEQLTTERLEYSKFVNSLNAAFLRLPKIFPLKTTQFIAPGGVEDSTAGIMKDTADAHAYKQRWKTHTAEMLLAFEGDLGSPRTDFERVMAEGGMEPQANELTRIRTWHIDWVRNSYIKDRWGHVTPINNLETASALAASANEFDLSPNTPNIAVAPYNVKSATDGRFEFESLNEEPAFVYPGVNLVAKDFKYVLIELSADCPAIDTWAQFFWIAGDQTQFSEICSLKFPIHADGTTKSYLLSLDAFFPEDHIGTGWQSSSLIHTIRFDPIAHQGKFTLKKLTLRESA